MEEPVSNQSVNADFSPQPVKKFLNIWMEGVKNRHN
jgi:hypothetical protein